MLRRLVENAFRPLMTYLEITVLDPLDSVSGLLKKGRSRHEADGEVTKVPSTNASNHYSVLSAVRKQRRYVSRERPFARHIESVTKEYLPWQQAPRSSLLH